jgi:hypothetical protein
MIWEEPARCIREQGKVLGVIRACEELAMLGNWDKYRRIYIVTSGYQI